ncbi:hypothetical protein TNCV_153821 [Trichonephila clavipes]|nr:hypothetical protein TNCV_153821 [Trichonephila clavipes]
MLKHLRFDIFELLETKLPLRLMNTTTELRLAQGHETTPLRVKGDIKDVSVQGEKKSNGAKGMQHSSGHITDFIGIKGVMAAVGVYDEEGRGNRDPAELPGSACILCRF